MNTCSFTATLDSTHNLVRQDENYPHHEKGKKPDCTHPLCPSLSFTRDSAGPAPRQEECSTLPCAEQPHTLTQENSVVFKSLATCSWLVRAPCNSAWTLPVSSD